MNKHTRQRMLRNTYADSELRLTLYLAAAMFHIAIYQVKDIFYITLHNKMAQNAF